MEHLIKCSKVLYDTEISNKMKEIAHFKKQLHSPRVVCKDMESACKKLGDIAKKSKQV